MGKRKLVTSTLKLKTVPVREYSLAEMVAYLCTDNVDPPLRVSDLAWMLGITEKAVDAWLTGKRPPRSIYGPSLRVALVRYALTAARPMLTSFVKWARANGLRGPAALNTMVQVLLDVARENDGCPRCVHSRLAENKTSRPLVIRDCAVGRKFPGCRPTYLHPCLLKTQLHGSSIARDELDVVGRGGR